MKCPGQDSRYWRPGDIFEAKCPKCGAGVEFFKDEPSRRCKQCGHLFINPQMNFGCASYCKYAEQCLGTLSPELLAHREDLLKDRVAVEMKRHYGRDFRRIGRASRAARHAENIGRGQKGNLAVILIASYLYEVERDGSEPGRAREILARLGAKKELVDEVSGILAHKEPPRGEPSLEGRVVHDAHLLARLEEQAKEDPQGREGLAKTIDETFLTESGKGLAKEVLLSFS